MSKAKEKFIEELNKEHEIILGFQEYEKKIADLEAKLAESEKELEKQKEKYDKLYGCYKKTSNEDLQDKYRLAEEIEQLKQQLHDLPKKIVEEIREICKLNIRTYKIHSQDDCIKYKVLEGFNKAIFGVLEFLDTLLKKYGGEDE